MIDDMNLIEKLFENKLNEKINIISKYKSSQNNVFRIITQQNDYTLKVYSKDAICNDEELKRRREQLKYAKFLYEKGINVILPLEIDGDLIFEFNKRYFSLTKTFANDKKIKIINAIKLFTNIHYPELKLNIENHYKKVNLKINEIQDLIDKSNYYVENVSNLCISHNDFKPLNILWKEREPYLIDFDAVSYSNKCASLIEFALNFSKVNRKINYRCMKKIFKIYFKENDKENFDMAFYLSLNGKLSWLEYLIDSNNSDKDEMIELLSFYIKSKKKIEKIYNKA